MNQDDLKTAEAQRQTLLAQLTTAEAALRSGVHATRGFGSNARAHMERAQSHICEAYIAINEGKPVRTVQQLVDDLNQVPSQIENADDDETEEKISQQKTQTKANRQTKKAAAVRV